MSDVPARWGDVARVVEMVKEHNLKNNKNILVIGNGDVKDIADGLKKAEETNCDGIMIGRGAFGKPWLFNKNKAKTEISLEQRFKILLEHSKLFESTLGGRKNFSVMKKHYKAYVNGFPGAVDLRIKLMEANDYMEVESIITDFLKTLVK